MSGWWFKLFGWEMMGKSMIEDFGKVFSYLFGVMGGTEDRATIKPRCGCPAINGSECCPIHAYGNLSQYILPKTSEWR